MVAKIERLIGPVNIESGGNENLRQLQLLVTLMNIKELSAMDEDSLTSMVYSILDHEHVLDNLKTASNAALVAGKLRLKGCIPTLVRRITLPGPPQPRLPHGGNSTEEWPRCQQPPLFVRQSHSLLPLKVRPGLGQ